MKSEILKILGCLAFASFCLTGCLSDSSSADTDSIAEDSSSSLENDVSSSSGGNVPSSSDSNVSGSSGNETSGMSSTDQSSSSNDIPTADVPGSSANDASSSSVIYGTLVDPRDNQTYRTVRIFHQIWMAENLNYNYNEGSARSLCYEEAVDSCAKYGRLYTWSAAMDSAAVFSTAGKGCGDGEKCDRSYTVRGVCPKGWHLPSKDEWESLFDMIGKDVAGKKLKSTSGWPKGNGTDDFGFSVLPAGEYYRGSSSLAGFYTKFWLSSDKEEHQAYYANFARTYDSVSVDDYYKHAAYSVRCLSDSVAHSEVSYSSGTLTDSRDGQTYKTVKFKFDNLIEQEWMAENLNYDYSKGTAKSYCYDDETSNCDKYGRLYLWSAAMDSAAVFSTAGEGCGYDKTCRPSGTVRGVCPEGWHLPSSNEWSSLFANVGGKDVAGKKLKSTSGWNSNDNGTDSFGFAVLPAGGRSYDGNFYGAGNLASFWSSTEREHVWSSDTGYRSDYFAYYWYFNYYSGEGVDSGVTYKYDGFSVRCLRDFN